MGVSVWLGYLNGYVPKHLPRSLFEVGRKPLEGIVSYSMTG